MAEFYVSITGSKQGKFKPEGAPKPYQEKIAGWGFHEEEYTHVDHERGSTGKREHSPIKFTKKVGPATPQLACAQANNEMLTCVLFEFLHRKPDGGGEMVCYTVKLTNAFVVLRQTSSSGEDDCPQETLGLTYAKIEWEHKEAKTLAHDNWFGHGEV